MSLKLNKISNYSLLWYTPIVMVVYYLEMRGITFTHSLFLMPIFALLCYGAFKIFMTSKHSTFVSLIFLYLLYNFFSVIWYIDNNVPIACFKEGIMISIIPISFSFFGYKLQDKEPFYKIFIYSCFVCFVIGFYLYIVRPSYYTEFITRVAYNGSENMAAAAMNSSDVLNAYRFSSFFSNNYRISYFCIPAMIISLSYYSEKREDKNKMLCVALTSFIVAIISFQRITQFYSIVVLLFFFYYWRKIGKRYFVNKLVLSSAILLFIVLQFANVDMVSQMQEMMSQQLGRFNFGSAMAERTNQFEISRVTPESLVFGLGLGSCGYPVLPYGLKGVYDCEYVKMFYEIGFVGIIIFIWIMLLTIKRGFSNLSNNYVELLIVGYFLTACVGSDALSMYVNDAIFWFAVGRIWCNKC